MGTSSLQKRFRSTEEQRCHELKVCLAVVRYMSQRAGERLKITRKPDSEIRNARAVDYLVEGPSKHYAMEHTLIESFPGQIASDQRFIQICSRLERENLCGGFLPCGDYVLVVISREEILRSKAWDTIRESLEAWVRTTAPALPAKATAPNGEASVRATPPGVPFEVELHWRKSDDFRFRVRTRTPPELEDKRRTRIRRALAEKCPKLAAAKKEFSVLVLELNDLALGDEHLVGNAIRLELPLMQDATPDEIHLVRSETSTWEVWPMKEGNSVYPNVPSNPLLVEHSTLDNEAASCCLRR